MSTSNFPSYLLAWRIFRYLLVQLLRGTLRLGWWLLTRSVLFAVGFLRLMASPASSGRSPDEFKDLVRPDATDGPAARVAGSDGSWRIYPQAYSARWWRMRRPLPMSAGKSLPRDDRQVED